MSAERWRRRVRTALVGLTTATSLAAGPAAPAPVPPVPPVPPAPATAGAPASATGAEARWTWPVDGAQEVVHPFDPPSQPWLPGHRGVDLAGRAGGTVRAVEGGVVGHSGVIAGTGVVTVLHGDGLRSTYQPVEDRLPAGTLVARGEALGVLSGPGAHCADRACLHLGAIRGRQTYVHPLLFLLPWELSLLPLDP